MTKSPSDHNDAVDAEIVHEYSENSSHESSSSHGSESRRDSRSEASNELINRLLSVEHWLRGLFMALFVVIACVASYVMFVLVILQFLFALITGASEERLQAFGAQLSHYLFQILRFITYNDEQKPFPFSDWPSDNESSGN